MHRQFGVMHPSLGRCCTFNVRYINPGVLFISLVALEFCRGDVFSSLILTSPLLPKQWIATCKKQVGELPRVLSKTSYMPSTRVYQKLFQGWFQREIICILSKRILLFHDKCIPAVSAKEGFIIEVVSSV